MLVASSYSLHGLQLMATSVDDYERSQVRTNRVAQRMRLIRKRDRESDKSAENSRVCWWTDEFFKRTQDCVETAWWKAIDRLQWRRQRQRNLGTADGKLANSGSIPQKPGVAWWEDRKLLEQAFASSVRAWVQRRLVWPVDMFTRP